MRLLNLALSRNDSVYGLSILVVFAELCTSGRRRKVCFFGRASKMEARASLFCFLVGFFSVRFGSRRVRRARNPFFCGWIVVIKLGRFAFILSMSSTKNPHKRIWILNNLQWSKEMFVTGRIFCEKSHGFLRFSLVFLYSNHCRRQNHSVHTLLTA